MKTLSPQAPSPLGSPFLWPGVEGPGSPGSPKQGAPHATPHTGTASHFSLEHPMVSRDPPSASRDRCCGCSVGGWHTGSGQQADPRAPPESSDPPASMWRGKQALACPQRWLPTLAAWGCPSKPLAHLLAHLSRCLQLGWDFPSWLLGSRSAICFPSHASGCLSLHEAQRTRNSVLGGTFLKTCWGHVLSSTELNSPSLTSPPWLQPGDPPKRHGPFPQQPEHLEAAATALVGPCSSAPRVPGPLMCSRFPLLRGL